MPVVSKPSSSSYSPRSAPTFESVTATSAPRVPALDRSLEVHSTLVSPWRQPRVLRRPRRGRRRQAPTGDTGPRPNDGDLGFLGDGPVFAVRHLSFKSTFDRIDSVVGVRCVRQSSPTARRRVPPPPPRAPASPPRSTSCTIYDSSSYSTPRRHTHTHTHSPVSLSSDPRHSPRRPQPLPRCRVRRFIHSSHQRFHRPRNGALSPNRLETCSSQP